MFSIASGLSQGKFQCSCLLKLNADKKETENVKQNAT